MLYAVPITTFCVDGPPRGKTSGDFAGGNSSDLFFAFRCFTMGFCFAKSVNAVEVPGYNAPIIEAMGAADQFL